MTNKDKRTQTQTSAAETLAFTQQILSAYLTVRTNNIMMNKNSTNKPTKIETCSMVTDVVSFITQKSCQKRNKQTNKQRLLLW